MIFIDILSTEFSPSLAWEKHYLLLSQRNRAPVECKTNQWPSTDRSGYTLLRRNTYDTTEILINYDSRIVKRRPSGGKESVLIFSEETCLNSCTAQPGSITKFEITREWRSNHSRFKINAGGPLGKISGEKYIGSLVPTRMVSNVVIETPAFLYRQTY